MADLHVDGLGKEYPTPTTPLVVLRDVSLSLSAGESLAIVGPSGSGKSTLLQIIGTLDRPTSGHVTIGGHDPFRLSDNALAQFRNQQIGFVFQDHYLLPQLTAWENVLVPGLAQGRVTTAVTERARILLERVGLADRLAHRPAELSGGERQRVAIARALVREPTLLLADEPTGNLDRTTAAGISDLLLSLQADSQPPMMLIVVTHSLALAQRMNNCYELDGGSLCSVVRQT